MPVAQSSHLQSYDYDTNSQTLTVEFTNGTVYQYPGVSLEDFNRLAQSGGGGTAFWAFIRNKYTGAKVADTRRRNQGDHHAV